MIDYSSLSIYIVYSLINIIVFKNLNIRILYLFSFLDKYLKYVTLYNFKLIFLPTCTIKKLYLKSIQIHAKYLYLFLQI